MHSFDSLGLSKPILDGVRAAGYSSPTPIQAATIPAALEGRDLIGCAQTGTGKTAAFVLPLLDRLVRSTRPGPRAVRALVVAPTRELALQVEQAVRAYGKQAPFYSLAIYGGVGIGPQFKALKRGVDIVVATPGRLLDHLDRGSLDLSRVEVLVLDEADRMFDMGFINDIRKIVKAVPKKRQTLLFSATMPPAIQKLTDEILRDPEVVKVGQPRNAAETVAQQACGVASSRKMNLLLHVLETEPVESVIVFSRTKHRADKISRTLDKRGFSSTAIHSNRSQNQRQRALAGFKNGKFQVLVATDIAARGIDVDSISHVINYDTPNVAEDYIHRIGRTGRAETTGDAITFVSPDEEAHLRTIERHTGTRMARKVYAGFESDAISDRPAAESRPQRGGKKHGRGRSSKRRR